MSATKKGEGTSAPIEYTTCPLCGMTKVHERTFQAVPSDYEIIQVRIGGGRGVGFVRQEGQGTTLEELPRSRPQLYRNLLEQARILLAELEAAGGPND